KKKGLHAELRDEYVKQAMIEAEYEELKPLWLGSKVGLQNLEGLRDRLIVRIMDLEEYDDLQLIPQLKLFVPFLAEGPAEGGPEGEGVAGSLFLRPSPKGRGEEDGQVKFALTAEKGGGIVPPRSFSGENRSAESTPAPCGLCGLRLKGLGR